MTATKVTSGLITSVSGVTGAGATILINRATFSTASTVSITGFNSALYDSYQLHIHGLVSNDAVNFHMRTSTDGGSSYDSGSGNYIYSMMYNKSGATSPTGGGSASDTQVFLSGPTTIGNASGEGFLFEVDFIRPDDATNRTLFKWHGAYIDASALTWNGVGTGERNSAADVDGIQIYASAGTITGSYQFLGFKK